MSVRILSKVWEGYPGDSSAELLALLALADWSDDEGRSFPSIASIGRKCRIKSRQAQRLVHRLIDIGLVSVIENSSGGKPGSTRRYRINLDRLTGVENVRGVINDTGVKNDADGCHLRRETGGQNDTLTVIDTSVTVSKGSSSSSKRKKKASGITMKAFLDACNAAGEDAILESDPVFKYAAKIGLPAYYLQLGWIAFKDKQKPNKQQEDWRKTFGNYVKNPDWLGVWKINRDGEYYLTDAGKQAEREFAGTEA